MLSSVQAETIARTLFDRQGEVALAAAVFQWQRAAINGDTTGARDWSLIVRAAERQAA